MSERSEILDAMAEQKGPAGRGAAEAFIIYRVKMSDLITGDRSTLFYEDEGDARAAAEGISKSSNSRTATVTKMVLKGTCAVDEALQLLSHRGYFESADLIGQYTGGKETPL